MLIFQMFSMVHIVHKTPGPAIVVTVAMTLILLIPNDFDALINMLSFTGSIFIGSCCAAVLILRRKYPHLKRPYRVSVDCGLTILVYIASLESVQMG